MFEKGPNDSIELLMDFCWWVFLLAVIFQMWLGIPWMIEEILNNEDDYYR